MRHAQFVFTYKQILSIKYTYRAILVSIRSCFQLVSESGINDPLVSIAMATATHSLGTTHLPDFGMVVCIITWHLMSQPRDPDPLFSFYSSLLLSFLIRNGNCLGLVFQTKIFYRPEETKMEGGHKKKKFLSLIYKGE